MFIHSLTIQYDNKEKKFNFSQHNLIKSDKNSVGKSTLLRLLFYSLGYQIPGTVKFPFKKVNTNVEITLENDRRIKISRKSKDLVTVYYLQTNDAEQYMLPSEENQLLSLIFGTRSPLLLKNIIGAIYLEQDKGWMLLNRGTVIGNIRFNIDELILGLGESGQNDNTKYVKIMNVFNELKALDNEIKKLNVLKNIQEIEQEGNIQVEHSTTIDELKKQQQVLDFKIKKKKSQIKDIKSVLMENNNFKRFINKMNLSIQDPDNEERTIPVSIENIKYFSENYDYINARLAFLSFEMQKLVQEQNKNLINVHKLEGTELLGSNASLVYQALQTSSVTSIDQRILLANLKEMQNKRSELKQLIQDYVEESKYADDMEKSVLSYAKELDVLDFVKYKKSGKYLFTNHLKELSGTVLHNLVFIFKLSYVREIDKMLNTKLPIILDSPHGREVQADNVSKTADIIARDFQSNQIFVASIYDFEMENKNIITLTESLMENSEKVLDHAEIKLNLD
ncbi:hypothetical protein [uncultured Fructobacillus sp.]|uniref:hypothetical protein n=1 Tax=uncultured Fructobacillus sp. TaxID=591942 RepID=UPI00259562A8|nr:hypothetical protein [uncultured Fructobacillus sp.]